MASWGVVVKPGEPYILEPSPGRRLKICQAMLSNHVDVGWSTLQCNVGDKEPVRLCRLNPRVALMCHLNLEYEEKENVVFSIIGNSSIHLAGYYIHSCNGDHDHDCEKLTSRTARPTDLKRKHKGDGAHGKNNSSQRKPNSSEDGDDSKIMEPSGVHTEPTQDDEMTQKGNVLLPAVQEQATLLTEGNNVAEKHIVGQIMLSDQVAENYGSVHTIKGPIRSRNGDHGKNDTSPTQPPLKDHIVSEDGDDDDEHLPILTAFFKRKAAEKRKCKMLGTEHVLSDQNNAMGQVNDKNDYKIMAGRFLFTGATELQGVRKRKGHIHKKTLGNGLIIEDLVMGSDNGEIASQGSKVTVKYVGKLLNGKTVEPMDVYTFNLGAGLVILGWDLGILGMRVGGKRRLTIPPALGYGDKAQEEIPAHSWLVYELELTKVE